MKNVVFIRFLAIFCLTLFIPTRAWTQLPIKDFTILYNQSYQIDEDFSVQYDNIRQAAKLNEFKVEFYAPDNTKLGETNIESFPVNIGRSLFSLSSPVKGFSRVDITVFSLHQGSFSDFPTSLNAFVELTESNIVEKKTVLVRSVNRAPIATDYAFEIDASAQDVVRDISSAMSDPDGDRLTVTPQSYSSDVFSFSLQKSGVLTLLAPDYTGHHSLTYQVQDNKGQSASADISVSVVLPPQVLQRIQLFEQSLQNLQTEIQAINDEILQAGGYDTLVAERDGLLQSLHTLSNSHYGSKYIGEIDALKIAIEDSKLTQRDQSNFDTVERGSETLQNSLDKIKIDRERDGLSLTALLMELSALEQERAQLSQDVNAIKRPTLLSSAQLKSWNETYQDLNQKLKKRRAAFAGFVGMVAVIGLMAWALLRRFLFVKTASITQKNLPRQSFKLKRSQTSGRIFPESPLLAGAVASPSPPLAPLGTIAPSGLQTLTGPYADLKSSYLATGRIGGPQEGIPTNDDVSLGTGFLISPYHVITNQHVYEFYKHYLTGPDCVGIEFIAEHNCEKSDFFKFDGEPPLILPDLDIAIFTLVKKVTNRIPIQRISIPTEDLEGIDVFTVSYPCPFVVDDVILSAVEKDPVFAIKRISQGRVFRHTTNSVGPFGVSVAVDSQINPDERIEAICHNASTLGGSSGAPLLDKSGTLIGVHFAGDRAFKGQEAANLAMAIETLQKSIPEKLT